jgi:hypothetical protein
MKPSFWSGHLEFVPGSKILQPWPIYRRLWEYLDKDFKYLGYDKTVKAAMAKYGKLTEQQFSFALDISQLPYLEVIDPLDKSDRMLVDNYKVIGDNIYVEEECVKALEDGRDFTTTTKAGQEVQYLGVLILAGLVEWGNKRKGIIKPSYYDELDAFFKAVYGQGFTRLQQNVSKGKKPLAMIRK